MGNKMEMKLPEQVSYIIHRLEEHGYEAYAVGGCVRDVMLGREPEDWDITTSAKPLQVKEIFPRTIDTGIQHGTVTVMVDHVGYEVTTYRIDGEYQDGRHPKEVAFTSNLHMDLERRDFTINAMAYNDQEGLVDVFDGMGDLQRKMIRCVGDAGQRFDEDALRMLRAVRFSGQLGFSIQEDTRTAILERAHHLEKISAERIRVELTKLLVSPGAGQIREAYRTGMTRVFLPELDQMMEWEQHNFHHSYTVGEHSIRGIEGINAFFQGEWHDRANYLSEYAIHKITDICGNMTKKQHMILAVTMLLHDISKPKMMHLDEEGVGHFYGHPQESERMAEKIMKRLTFDNETRDTVGRLIRWHDYRMEPRAGAVRRAASKIGPDMIWMLFLVQYADVLAQNPSTFEDKLGRLDRVMEIYQQIELEEQALSIKELAVDGKDLIQAGIEPGPRLGTVLRQLLELVLESPEYNDREKLLEEVEKIVGMDL